MKILVFKQPYPMGNYLLNEVLSKRLFLKYDDVYLLEQLNGRKPDKDYIQQLVELQPDVIYFEMLDVETFELIKTHFKAATKILCYTSNGIFRNQDILLEYKGLYFDKVITNSKIACAKFKKNKIECELFKYYFSVISDIDLVYNEKYNHACSFLGMGFNRQTSNEYHTEQNIFFKEYYDIDYAIYGNGWNHKLYKGVLPPDDIGSLYFSSVSAAAIIAPGQRLLGMINNRYTEIANSLCPVITINYPSIDWYGMDKFFTFVDSRSGFLRAVDNLVSLYKNDMAMYTYNCAEAKIYINGLETEFFDNLYKLIDG